MMPLIIFNLRNLFLIFSIGLVAIARANNNYIVSSLSDGLPYDDNGRLSTHVLVYPEGRCADIIEDFFRGHGQPYGIVLRAVSGTAQRTFFGGEGGGILNSPPTFPDDCRSVCIERGVEKSLVSSVMPPRHYSGSEPFLDWFLNRCQKQEVCFMNYINPRAPVNMYWINHENQPLFHHALRYGEPKTFCCDSYLGHTFRFEDSETGEFLREVTVEHTSMISIGEAPPYQVDPRTNYTSRIHATVRQEWARHKRIGRTFSPLGFRKGRLPDDLFASMGAFHYNNFDNRVREEWGGKGVFVNWWENDVLFVQIPWKLKDSWQARLRHLVEQWVGEKLEQTDMYGLRRYERGARLLTHVDREATHAASLIVNIAQGNVDEPWPVEIHDHADRLHQIAMEPGDIVYYESAKCLHGRNTPLRGDGSYYVNLFTHYRPVGDPLWFRKPNPRGTPQPLLDVGNCRPAQNTDAASTIKIECDNPAIGPYLSPTMFAARSGEDLFEWWRMVGPPPPNDGDEGSDHEKDNDDNRENKHSEL